MIRHHYRAGTKKSYRQGWKKRALSWCISLLKESRVPVAQQGQPEHGFRRRFSTLKGTRDVPRSHVAAVCYRVQGSRVELLLVRTRAGRWTFPKGRVEGDPSRAAAAAREAFEEAGVFGRVETTPICQYRHSKQPSFHFDEHLVDAHLCEVVCTVPPQEVHRDPTWFDAEKAKRRLCEHRKAKYASELSMVVDRAVEQIQRKHRVI